MDALILLTIIAASMMLAIVGARGMLLGVLHVMAHPPHPSTLVGDMRSSMRRALGSGV